MLIRAAVLALLGVAGALSWGQLSRYATWQGYAALADDVLHGRAVPEDLERFAALLELPPTETCEVLRTGAPVTLYLYANDVIARELDVSPQRPTTDPRLSAHRLATRRVLANALACTPTDGNLWLSKAIFARMLGEDPAAVAGYLAMSERYAPHEGWISTRRARLF